MYLKLVMITNCSWDIRIKSQKGESTGGASSEFQHATHNTCLPEITQSVSHQINFMMYMSNKNANKRGREQAIKMRD